MSEVDRIGDELPEIAESDDVLALALARGSTRLEAATVAGVSERTVYDRLSRPEFRSRVHDYRREILDRAVGSLSSLAEKAATVLGQLLEDESAHVRYRAASTILDALLRVRTHVELEERLAEIERQVGADGRKAI